MTNIHRLHPQAAQPKLKRVRHYPPRGLRAPDAAYYIGVSQSKFFELVEDGKMPAGKRDEGIVVWDREALDLAFDAWGQSESASPGADEAPNSFDDD